MTHERLRQITQRCETAWLTPDLTSDLLAEQDAVVAERDKLRAENEELRELLQPCRPDTDAQTDPAYPATVNDVLHLLSCYIADFLPDDVILSDEYFSAWERQARPVIERIMKPTD
jgi:hypothetical protein